MNILITGIGGPTPRSIAKTIRASFPDSKIIGVDANRKALGFYMKNLVDHFEVVKRADDKDYWQNIEELKEKYAIDFAFIQPEKEVLEWGRFLNETGHLPIPTTIPPFEYTNALMDKANMADLLAKTDFIPKTIRITKDNPKFDEIENEIGYPCWIRATVGTGGLGSLVIESKENLNAWLMIHKNVPEFTISEYLTGRHLANQMLYIEGELIKNAGLECAEYVMADVAPSKVTGNTSYGRFLNEDKLLDFCEECMSFISEKLQVKPHGVFSFDLKEDFQGNLKVTEINIRHMAYTGILSQVGFNLVGDTIKLLTSRQNEIKRGRHHFDKNYIFLRDVDIEPIVMTEEELLD